MAPFEALYGRKCRSPLHWSEIGERLILGLDVLQVATNKVLLARERLVAAQCRQKSYADKRRRELEFQVGDHVFLKVLPTKEIKSVDHACFPLCRFAHACESRFPQAGTLELAYVISCSPCKIGHRSGLLCGVYTTTGSLESFTAGEARNHDKEVVSS
uniref:Uncharacterized protein n=1 Tax=Ananas comosus var. bracteatus TaxID=296719 RepID=A0A6V7P4S0_ANACO|nr:unnamed protein product [Ananas comosus var. bracteatus]